MDLDAGSRERRDGGPWRSAIRDKVVEGRPRGKAQRG